MKQFKKILALILCACLFLCTFSGCSKNTDSKVLMSSKTRSYVVESDGSETFISYSIYTLYQDGTSLNECYTPNGTLLYTIHNDGTVYEDAYTDEIADKLNSAAAIMSLVGTGSDDLIYEVKKDARGFTTDEYFSSKSGTYPTLHLNSEVLVDNITK